MLGLLFTATACTKEDCDCEVQTPSDLVSPALAVRMFESFGQKPFTGVLEVYPCEDQSSLYYGNYVNGSLSPFSGFYMVKDGGITSGTSRSVQLPVGDYNMVYWGTPKYDYPIYSSPAITHPGFTLGGDLSELYFGLRKNVSDTTYMPTYDLVHAVTEAHVGEEDLHTSLTRVGAGLNLTVRKKEQDASFSENVVAIKAQIGGIAERLNAYTGEPVNMTKTVQFDLTRSEDNMSMSCPTVMLFPSSPFPVLKLIIYLKDGSVHEVKQVLNTTLSPNTLLTLNVTIGKILVGEDSGSFEIDEWDEKSEEIEFPDVI